MGLSVKHLRDLFGGNVPTAQVLQSVASGMADCGVKVVIDPRTNYPYAEPQEKRIVLPSRVKSSRALLIVSWYVDHEAGHIIHTPSILPIFKKYLNNSKMKDICVARGYNGVPDKIVETAKFFLNCVEDVRIEKLMIHRFPGSKKHFIGGPLAAECDTLVEDTIEKAERMAEENGLEEIPISPFFVAEMHASAVLDGTHGQRERDYVRELVPEHVRWACDIAEDVFGDIADITQFSCFELGDRVDTAMAKILDKILPDLNDQDEDEDTANAPGEGECQDGTGDDGSNPFSSDMKGSKTPQKSKYDDLRDKEEGDGDDQNGSAPGDQGTGQGKRKSGDSEGGSEGSSGGDEGGDEGSPDGDGSSSEGAGEGEGSEEGSGDGRGRSGVDPDGDDSEGGGGSSGGSEEGDDEDDQSSSDGCGGDDDSTESDDDSEADDGDSEGGSEEGDGEDGDDVDNEDEDGDSEGEPVNEDPQPVTGEIDKNARFQQVLQWAEDAQVDMSQMMKESDAFAQDGEGDDQGAQANNQQGPTPGSPSLAHAKDIDGMPQQYLDRMAPGCGVHVIEGLDLTNLFNTEDPAFSSYDNFIRSLMPRTLGPAARKLVGKFHGAQGKAWSGNRVNPRMLQPIVAGKAYGRKLYLKRTEPIQSKRGVCVGLLIDCSGSMCSSVSGLQFQNQNYYWNSKFAIAHVAARSIARLLQTVNVPFAVAGFTTTPIQNSMSLGRSTYSASRNQDIVNFLFKDFEDPWTVSEPQMIAMNANTNVTYKGTYINPQTNSDGESLLWFASSMIARQEDRKVLIVLSDGLPYAGHADLQSKFLKWAVRRVEIAGIHIGALGLGDRGVEHYYRIHELIDEFPAGYGTELTAPLYIQEKILRLIDKLSD